MERRLSTKIQSAVALGIMLFGIGSSLEACAQKPILLFLIMEH